MKRNSRTPKQGAAFIVMAIILMAPMLCLINFFSQHFSDRQVAAIGGANLVVAASLLGLIDRKWIRHLK